MQNPMEKARTDRQLLYHIDGLQCSYSAAAGCKRLRSRADLFVFMVGA